MKTSERYCVIQPDKGLVHIRLTVDEDLMCGAEFSLYPEGSEVSILDWKMSASNGNFDVKGFKTDPKNLSKFSLVWQIICCAQNPKIYEGFVEIEITQGGQPCKMTIPARWELDNIPPCAIKKSSYFTESLTFIVKA